MASKMSKNKTNMLDSIKCKSRISS